MAEYYRPQQEEAGFDKFLRRLGGGLQIAKSGYDLYNAPLERRAKEQQQALQGAQLANIEKETALMPEKYKQSQEDRKLDNMYKQSMINERLRQPQKEADDRAFRNQERQDKIDLQTLTKKDAALEKLKSQTVEVAERKRNIDDSVDALEAMIKENGTFDFTGAYNQNLDRLVEGIATDMAKLSDPSSVARPTEVEAWKKNLIQSGLFQRNANALDILKTFKGEVQKRADNAYKVRGLTPPTAEGSDKNLNTLIQGGGKIKVSNGKETVFIDKSDLADAQKDGFKVVQ